MSPRSVPSCVVGLIVLVSGSAAPAGEGVVALQTAAPSCANDSGNRYVNCGKGTVTDNQTGLVWLANANCLGLMVWYEAVAAVANLSDLPDDTEVCDTLTRDQCDCGLSDGSSPGEWRLPSIAEWEAMVSPTCGNPALSDDEGTGCWNSPCDPGSSCSFYSVESDRYWSSTTYHGSGNSTHAWEVDLGDRIVVFIPKAVTNYVWPVRGGQ